MPTISMANIAAEFNDYKKSGTVPRQNLSLVCRECRLGQRLFRPARQQQLQSHVCRRPKAGLQRSAHQHPVGKYGGGCVGQNGRP